MRYPLLLGRDGFMRYNNACNMGCSLTPPMTEYSVNTCLHTTQLGVRQHVFPTRMCRTKFPPPSNMPAKMGGRSQANMKWSRSTFCDQRVLLPRPGDGFIRFSWKTHPLFLIVWLSLKPSRAISAIHASGQSMHKHPLTPTDVHRHPLPAHGYP